MRHCARKIAALVGLSVAAVFAPAAHALDLLDVWRAATLHDPGFRGALAAHDAGRARRDQAGSLWRPNVVLEGGVALASHDSAVRGARFSAPGSGQSSGVAFDTSIDDGIGSRVALSVRQPLFSREREVQGRQLQIAADAADFEWNQAQQALMLRSAERYFEVALAAEQLRLLTRQQTAVDRAFIEAQDRFRLGDRPIIDTQEAAARAADLKAQRLAAATELELKRAALVDFTGLALDARPLPLPAEAPAAGDIGDLAGWLARTEQDNPALHLARAGLLTSEQEARKTSAALAPSVDLVARLGRDRLAGSGSFGSASNSVSERSIGVQLSVPLYTGGWREARQIEARALVDKAGAELEQARQQVMLQTRSAWLELAVGNSQVAALEAAAHASRSRLDATRVGREAGDRTTLDLLNAENDAGAAELSVTRARVRLLMNRLRLVASAGQLDEPTLRQINAALQPAH
ncbi:MAG: TolC family protein [Caldimonas sp.]